MACLARCFGRGQVDFETVTAPSEPPAPAPVPAHGALAKQSRRIAAKGSEVQQTEYAVFRCKLAGATGSWTSRLAYCSECLLGHLHGARFVGVYGLASGGQPNNRSLVTLAASASQHAMQQAVGGVGPGATVGGLLPVPQRWSGALQSSLYGASELYGKAPVGVHVLEDYDNVDGSGTAPEAVAWQFVHAPASKASSRKDMEQAPPREWQHLAQAVLPPGACYTSSCSSPCTPTGLQTRQSYAASLVPLLLGKEVVGAVLVVADASDDTWQTAGTGSFAGAASDVTYLEPLARAVAECALAPSLGEIRQFCEAASSLASAGCLQEFANTLSSILSDRLTRDLHVDLAVRMALVPYLAGQQPQHGFMLMEAAPAAPYGGTAASESLSVGGFPLGRNLMTLMGDDRSRASQPLSKLAGSAIGVDAPSGPPHPQQQHHHALQASGTQSFALQAGSGDGSSLARQWKARPFLLESTLLAALLAKTPVIAPSQSNLVLAAAPSARLLNQPSLNPHHLASTGYFSEAMAGHTQNNNSSNHPSSSAPPTTNHHTNAQTSSSIPGALMALLPSAAATVNTHSTHSLDRMPRGNVGATMSTITSCGSSRALPSTTAPLARAHRVESMAHACINSYMEDEEQPAGDVWLLLKRAGAGAAGGGLAGGGGAVGGLPPSSSLLPGGPSISAMGERGSAVVGGGGPVSLVLAASAVHVPCAPLGTGLDGSVMDSMATGQGGVGVGVGVGMGTGGVGMGTGTSTTAMSLERFQALRHAAGRPAGPCDGEAALLLAVYVTAGERLPASLLRAARGRAHSLLEMLMPAVACCMSGPAVDELELMLDVLVYPASATATAAASASFSTSQLHQAHSGLPSAVGRSHSRAHMSASGLGSGSTRAVVRQPLATVPSPLLVRGSSRVSNSAGPGVGPGWKGGGGAGGANGELMTLVGSMCVTSEAGLAQQANASASSFTRDLTGGVPTPGVDSTQCPWSPFTATLQSSALSPTADYVPSNKSRFAPDSPFQGSLSALPQSLSARALDICTLRRSATGGMPNDTAAHASARAGAHASSHVSATATTTTHSYHGMLNTSTSFNPVRQLRPRNAQTATGITTRCLASGSFIASRDPLDLAVVGRLPGSGTVGGGRRESAGRMGGGLLGRTCSVADEFRSAVLMRANPSDLAPARSTDVVADSVTVVRSNMEYFVSTFANKFKTGELGVTPTHADDDIRNLRLLRVLGTGGCSTVYAGTLHGLEVAVKVMEPAADADADPASDESPSRTAQPSSPHRGGGGAEGGGAADGSNSTGIKPLNAAARQAQLRALMRGARELAVMSGVSHPHIVQIYTYHTRVLVEQPEEEEHSAVADGAEEGEGEAAKVLPRLTPVPQSVDAETLTAPLQCVVVMEQCDVGSLADALDNGMFQAVLRAAERTARRAGPKRSQTTTQLGSRQQPAGVGSHGGGGGSSASGRQLAQQLQLQGASSASSSSLSGLASGGGGGGGGGSQHAGAMHCIYRTLLEVALALRFLHSNKLVHCDVKAANVLLKSSISDPRGFTCKLTDFGFVTLLAQKEQGDAPTLKQQEPVGTLTHLAPETMIPGSKLDQSVDIYAFGIFMWEVFTQKAPYQEYAGNGFADLPIRVVRDGVRPAFPAGTPAGYRQLAAACWSGIPARRPSAAAVVTQLQRMMEGLDF